MLSLFRVATGEDWTDVMYINVYNCKHYPAGEYGEDCMAKSGGWIATIYFLVFMIIGGLVLLSLFVGVVTTAMDDATASQKEEKRVMGEVVDGCLYWDTGACASSAFSCVAGLRYLLRLRDPTCQYAAKVGCTAQQVKELESGFSVIQGGKPIRPSIARGVLKAIGYTTKDAEFNQIMRGVDAVFDQMAIEHGETPPSLLDPENDENPDELLNLARFVALVLIGVGKVPVPESPVKKGGVVAGEAADDGSGRSATATLLLPRPARTPTLAAQTPRPSDLATPYGGGPSLDAMLDRKLFWGGDVNRAWPRANLSASL